MRIGSLIILGLILSTFANCQEIVKIEIEENYIESHWFESTKFDTIIAKTTYYSNGDWRVTYLKETKKDKNITKAIAQITIDSNNTFILRKFIMSDSTIMFSRFNYGIKYSTEIIYNKDSIPKQILFYENVDDNNHRLLIDQVFETNTSFSSPIKSSRFLEYRYKSLWFKKYYKVTIYEQQVGQSFRIPKYKTVKFFRTFKSYDYDYKKKNWRLQDLTKYRKRRIISQKDLILNYKTLYFYDDSSGTQIKELWEGNNLVEKIKKHKYETKTTYNKKYSIFGK